MSRSEQDFETLVDGYLDQIRDGTAIDTSAFIAMHPAYATQLRTLLPMMMAMERIGAREDVRELRPSSALPLPQEESVVWGNYQLVGELGRGGMGIVYEALQLSLGRRVALKVLSHRAGDASFAKRFDREARAVARLDHPGIVKVYEVGNHAEVPFYSMQYVPGASLDRVISELRLADQNQFDGSTAGDRSAEGASTVAAALSKSSWKDTGSADTHVSGVVGHIDYYRRVAKIGIQAGQALQHAHDHGILHRDIKPANVLLDTSGNAWITDFGLAKADTDEGLTQTGDLIGTMRYMAPEAMQNRSDVRSEVYSLGLTLYELLALQPAFPETDRYRLMHSVVNNKPRVLRSVRSNIPADLETIVEKACDPEPPARYGSTSELAADLQRFIDDQPILARRICRWERLVRWSRRNKGLAAASALAAGLLCCLTAVSTLAAFYYYDLNAQLKHSVIQLETTRRSETLAKRKVEARAAENLRLAQLADVAKRTAEKKERTIHRNLYFAHMILAGQAASDPVGIHRVTEAVSRWKPGADEEDLRGWEWYFLNSHCNRADIVCEDVLSPIYWAAWSPDERWLATAGDGRDVEVWDATNGEHHARLRGHQSSVLCVQWSPDGRKLISVGGPTAMLWDVESKRGHKIIEDYPGVIHCAAWDPDGRRIAIAADGEVRVIDPAGKTLQTIEVPGGAVQSVSWHPDGKRLAMPWGANKIAYWSVQSGRVLKFMEGHEGRVRAVQWAPKGNQLASISHDNTLRFWQPASGRQMKKIVLPQSGRSVRWHPDGKSVVVAGEDNTARIVRTDGPQLCRPLLGHSNVVAYAAFSPNGKRVVTASADSTARIWNAHRGTAFMLAAMHNGEVNEVDWSPDGERLLSVSGNFHAEVFHVGNPSVPLRYTEHNANVSCGRFSGDGQRVATGDLAGYVYVWGVAAGETIGVTKFDSPVLSLAWSSEPQRLFCGLKDGSIQVLDFQSAEPPREIGRHGDVVLDLALSHDGLRLASCSADRSLCIWDVQSDACVQKIRVSEQRVNCIAWSPDDFRIATGSSAAQVQVFDVASGKQVRDLRGHHGSVFGVTWSPDGSRIVSGGNDRTIRIWDPESGEMAFAQQTNTASIRCVCFSPNGQQLAVASRDFTVKILDAAIGYRD